MLLASGNHQSHRSLTDILVSGGCVVASRERNCKTTECAHRLSSSCCARCGQYRRNGLRIRRAMSVLSWKFLHRTMAYLAIPIHLSTCGILHRGFTQKMLAWRSIKVLLGSCQRSIILQVSQFSTDIVFTTSLCQIAQ